jgi:phosphatidylglycerophosphate synthase
MLVAKQVADLITFSRAMMALLLACLGFAYGTVAFPLVVWIMFADWLGDMFDGTIARRSRLNYHTWIGDHDLEVDMFVSLGLLVYLMAAGFVPWWVGGFYLACWGVIFLKLGILHSPGMLFQAPIYAWFLWTALKQTPGLGMLLILFFLAAIILTWPKFPKMVVPGFLSGMRATLSSIRRTGRH